VTAATGTTMGPPPAYLRYELLRLVRNRKAFFFSLVFPFVLFMVFAASNRDTTVTLGDTTFGFRTYFMVSMAGYGAMIAAVSGGGRIAGERATGWTRQLRISPLSVRDYLVTKVLTCYLVALGSIVLLYAAGLALGVRLEDGWRWAAMTGLLLVGVAPFVAFGIAIGHLVDIDALGPVIGGGTAIMGLLGGVWFPPASGSILARIGRLTPSYYETAAGVVGVGGAGWGVGGWTVVVVWTAAMTALAVWAYRRDAARP